MAKITSIYVQRNLEWKPYHFLHYGFGVEVDETENVDEVRAKALEYAGKVLLHDTAVVRGDKNIPENPVNPFFDEEQTDL